MGRIPQNLLVHTVTVRRFLGSGATGNLYAPAASIPCFVEDNRQLVRNTDGREVVSQTTVYAAPETAYIPPESEVDVPPIGAFPARTTTVIRSTNHDGGGLATPDHVEANLA